MCKKNRSAYGERHSQVVLTEEQVRAIRAEYATGTIGYRKLAHKYGVGKGTIVDIIKGRNWSYLT
jgi:hypothetical protein